MFVLKSAYVRHVCYFTHVSALNITYADAMNVRRESCSCEIEGFRTNLIKRSWLGQQLMNLGQVK